VFITGNTQIKKSKVWRLFITRRPAFWLQKQLCIQPEKDMHIGSYGNVNICMEGRPRFVTTVCNMQPRTNRESRQQNIGTIFSTVYRKLRSFAPSRPTLGPTQPPIPVMGKLFWEGPKEKRKKL
jgi:hypothetical protein